jgi:hypothetical protein
MAVVVRSLLSMSALLCVLATAAAAPTEAAMGEAYARLVNVTGNQQLWAERAEVSEPVAIMDRFEDGARSRALEAPVPASPPVPGAQAPCRAHPFIVRIKYRPIIHGLSTRRIKLFRDFC